MILVVDTNIVFAGLLRKGLTQELLIDSPFTLYAPETMVTEIRKHQNLIVEKSGLLNDDFETLLNLLTDNINIVEKKFYTQSIEEADKLIGNVDKGDVTFLALALSMPNNGIWTENVKHFGKQNKIKIWTTEDILKFLEKL